LLFVRYDFAVYGLLAPEIGSVFFPAVSKELQLINSFGVYLAAFLMRPLGAVLFGEIGDRMVGRKNALVFSIILITIPSILMGCLPTYYDWGWIAPVLLVILRLFQGLSVGGQLAGSYVLSIEQSSQKTRGMRGSICDASSVRCFCSCWLLVVSLSFVQFLARSLLTFSPRGCAELWIPLGLCGDYHDEVHSHGATDP
jgi:MFS family permease